MINTILGIKKEMSVKFDEHGHRLPVTVIQADPNVVVLKKGAKILLGFGQKKRAKKTENSFVTAVGYSPRFTREVKVHQDQTVNIADKVTVANFAPGDEVKITGITKGKGFAGVVKRWHFAGGPKTHGQSDRHRAPGSIGQTTTPGRVYKGKKMAGHMGVTKLTITGLEVVEVDPNKNLFTVKGSVPGARNGFLIIEKTGKVKGHTPKEESEETKQKPATDKNTETQSGGTESASEKPTTADNLQGQKLVSDSNQSV